MATTSGDRVFVSEGASDLAFRAGQALERLLLHRALDFARNSGSPIVTVEHLERSFDADLHEQLGRAIKACGHDESTQRTGRREAA